MNSGDGVFLISMLVGCAGLYFLQKDYGNITKKSSGDDLISIDPIETASSQTLVEAPRGVRNNNWLNIEYNVANDWVGEVGTDGRYSRFSSPEYGIRAAAIILRKYYNGYGLKSVAGIIGRWAPATENNTSAYAIHVATRLGVTPTAMIALDDVLPELIHAMAIHECGHGTLPANADSIIAQGVALA